MLNSCSEYSLRIIFMFDISLAITHEQEPISGIQTCKNVTVDYSPQVACPFMISSFLDEY